MLGRGGRARGQRPSSWPVVEPVAVAETVTVADPVAVAEPVTVLDALEHMFASCSIILEHFEPILNEMKMKDIINN